MSYITTVSLRFKPGTRQEVERVYRAVLLARRRELVARGELLSTSMLRLGADAEGEDYQLISHWASKQAHDRNEDNPGDLAAQRAATPFLVTPRSYAEVRHQRLERFVRQLLVYGVLTGTLLLLYLSCVFALQMAIQALIGQTSSLVIVACTLGGAALFQPLRRRIQRMIDQRFYRDKYDALQMLEELKVTLRQEIDLTQLSEHILTIVNKTMHPASASLWLFPPHQPNNHSTASSSSEQIQVFGAQVISSSPHKDEQRRNPPTETSPNMGLPNLR
jgi:quinol monooxygenase YgiN